MEGVWPAAGMGRVDRYLLGSDMIIPPPSTLNALSTYKNTIKLGISCYFYSADTCSWDSCSGLMLTLDLWFIEGVNIASLSICLEMCLLVVPSYGLGNPGSEYSHTYLRTL